MRALPDVNVLIALLDADRLQHVAAREWISRNHRAWMGVLYAKSGETQAGDVIAQDLTWSRP